MGHVSLMPSLEIDVLAAVESIRSGVSEMRRKLEDYHTERETEPQAKTVGFSLVSNDELGLKMDAETAAMLNSFMMMWKMAKRKRREATKEPLAGRNAAWLL